MKRLFTAFFLAFAIPTTLVACADDDDSEICQDDLDCNDGFICELIEDDEGFCVGE